MERKFGLKKIGLAMLVFLMAANNVFAATLLDDYDIEVTSTIDFYSDYMWRGFLMDRDPVIQPGVNISTKGFTFSLWSSFDLDNNVGGQSDEVDFVIDYTTDIADGVSLSLGNTYYDFPASNTYSSEFYVGLGLSELAGLPVETSLTYFRDYGDQNNGGGLGSYFSLDFGYSVPLEEKYGITADFGLHLGYNNKLFIAGDSGKDLGLTAGLTIPLTETLTISPSVNYSAAFGDLEKASDGNQPDRFYTGLSIAYSF